MVLMLLAEGLFWPKRGLVWSWNKPAKDTVEAKVSAPGPWGTIEYTPIALDRPEEYFTNEFNGTPPRTRWVFRNHTEDQLKTLFSAIDLSSEARQWLSNRANWQISPHAIVLFPPAEVVVSLNSDTRQKLYAVLGANPENALHATPFRFRADGFDDWFAGCSVPEKKIELVRQLTYQHDGSLCFADAPAFAELSTPEETMGVIKCLWRVSTFLLRLRVDKNTDVEKLMSYWGKMGPARDYRPLIESMSRLDEGSTINLSYFLPPFARLRLYTYPNPRDPNIGRQDCFWSSMNFFNRVADNRFFNSDFTRQTLETDYTRVRDGSRQFGDLILLLGNGDQALHMCVYIADDVVFTKNGANTQQPWVLMKLPEMLGQYERDKPYEVRAYRRKSPPPVSAVQQMSAAHAL